MFQADDIRTIIKARGIAYPNINGRTNAAFRVDAHHHLVSLVSQIDPSPDWFVGVSGLELCLLNCSWVESRVIDLFPWDAGTDSAPSYESPNQPKHPPDHIRRIKHDSPNDPRSPFYDPTGIPMKPLARLYIHRQRVYDGADENCKEAADSPAPDRGRYGDRDDDDNGDEEENEPPRYRPAPPDRTPPARHDWTPSYNERKPPVQDDDDDDDNDCELTKWSAWGPCSASCGAGKQTRQREYKNPNTAEKCERTRGDSLRDQRTCKNDEGCGGDIEVGQKESEERPGRKKPGKPVRTKRCRLSQWSKWSPCSVTCGIGWR